MKKIRSGIPSEKILRVLLFILLGIIITGCSATWQNFIGSRVAGYGTQTEQKTDQPIKDLK